MKRTLGALILLSLMVPFKIQAQGLPQVGQGDRIRVTSGECFREVPLLYFSSFSGDTLWATSRNQNVGCPTSGISGIEVFRPTSTWIMGGIGLFGGGAVGAAFGHTENCYRACEDPGMNTHVGGVLGACTGLVLGVLLGTQEIFGGWEEVPVPPGQPSVFVSRGSRLNLGFSIPFR